MKVYFRVSKIDILKTKLDIYAHSDMTLPITNKEIECIVRTKLGLPLERKKDLFFVFQLLKWKVSGRKK